MENAQGIGSSFSIREKKSSLMTNVEFPRGMGLIMPIFSLPSPYGIGTLGKKAYEFCDFLQEAGQTYWQILPLGPTSFGDSPYSALSSFAGNPYFIDLDMLKEEGLLEESDLVDFQDLDPSKVDYGFQYQNRYKVLRKAFDRAGQYDLDKRQGFFERNQEWLKDYALYITIKSSLDGQAWMEWPDPLKNRDGEALDKIAGDYKDDIEFKYFLQYEFFKQWSKLCAYAEERGLVFIGDLPIYLSMDSSEVWAMPEEFLLDEKKEPTLISGAPPDPYSEEGQLWGNPLYDWEKMAEDGYGFWTKRMAHQLNLYHVIRLDHFIGFANYWAVPAEEKTAQKGSWVEGPGLGLFQSLEAELGPLPILLEDLGSMNNLVLELRDQLGYPGMKPIQFAFGEEDSEYLPHNAGRISSVYTSTHDSDTLMGWWTGLDEEERDRVRKYFNLNSQEGLIWGIIRGIAASHADICILQMQDLLELGNEARINVPGTIGGNWQWRVDENVDLTNIVEKLYAMSKLYGRTHETTGI